MNKTVLDRVKFLSLLLTAVFLPLGHGYAAQSRVALVIGNGGYASSPLANPVNDARDMAAKLSELGFKVSVFTDLDRKRMREAIREFGEQLKTSQVGLFYFAGHGIQLKGVNYLVPVGIDVASADEVEDESIDAYSVLRKMESAGNEVNIVILDACRNNPFARSFRGLEPGLAKMDGPIGSFIAYATAPGSVASDGDGRNGLYTENLLKALSQPGLTIEQTFKAVRRNVSDDTKGQQIPWESSSLTGEFYFQPATQDAVKPASLPTPAPVAYLQINGNVPEAAVSVNQIARGQLDADGTLNVSPLNGEEAEVAVSAPGYRTVIEKVKLLPGAWQQFNVMLEPAAGNAFRDSLAKPDGAANADCLAGRKYAIVGVRSEWRLAGQDAVVKLNDPGFHAAIFNGLKAQGWEVIDTPAEALDANPAQIALKLPAGPNTGYWLKAYVSAEAAPITTIETHMKTVQGDITLQLVDLATARIAAESSTKFRKAGLDIGVVVNQTLDSQLPNQIQTLIDQACR